MGTRCYIGVLEPDESIRYIYVHSEGFPSGVGWDLLNHYVTQEVVGQLVDGGDLSRLGLRPGESSFMGGPGVETKTVGSRDEYREELDGEWTEYAYLFNGEAWEAMHTTTGGFSWGGVRWKEADKPWSGEWIPLVDAITDSILS